MEDKIIDVNYEETENNNLVLFDEGKKNEIKQTHGVLGNIVVGMYNFFQKKMLDMDEQLENALAVNSCDSFITQTKFGEMFATVMSNKTVGDLFRIVGLAQRGSTRTKPYSEYIGIYADKNVRGYRWHYDSCKEHIDEWLEENNLKEEFYSHKTKGERKMFVDKLHREIIGD